MPKTRDKRRRKLREGEAETRDRRRKRRQDREDVCAMVPEPGTFIDIAIFGGSMTQLPFGRIVPSALTCW
jgi:hypothetical protein